MRYRIRRYDGVWWTGYDGRHHWDADKAKSFETLAKCANMLALMPQCLEDGIYAIYGLSSGGWMPLVMAELFSEAVPNPLTQTN